METLLIAAVALVCPVGMGLMMWFMAKGMRGENKTESQEPRLVEPSVADLHSEHQRLGAEIARLEGRYGEPERVASAGR